MKTKSRADSASSNLDGSKRVRSGSSRSASVALGVRAAAHVWNVFKAEELRYVDILEMCANLMCNVADKSQSTDHEISDMTRQLMHDMRKNSSSQNFGSQPCRKPSTETNET